MAVEGLNKVFYGFLNSILVSYQDINFYEMLLILIRSFRMSIKKEHVKLLTEIIIAFTAISTLVAVIIGLNKNPFEDSIKTLENTKSLLENTKSQLEDTKSELTNINTNFLNNLSLSEKSKNILEEHKALIEKESHLLANKENSIKEQERALEEKREALYAEYEIFKGYLRQHFTDFMIDGRIDLKEVKVNKKTSTVTVTIRSKEGEDDTFYITPHSKTERTIDGYKYTFLVEDKSLKGGSLFKSFSDSARIKIVRKLERQF